MDSALGASSNRRRHRRGMFSLSSLPQLGVIQTVVRLSRRIV
jgi:hypothetical protein